MDIKIFNACMKFAQAKTDRSIYNQVLKGKNS